MLVNWLLFFASVFIFHAIICISYALDYKDISRQSKLYVKSEVRPESANAFGTNQAEYYDHKLTVKVNAIIEEMKLRNLWQSLDVTYTTINTEYIGRYFITAYCPAECGGSWTTSSGATCHQSSDWTEPNTVAIDRRYHKYGELLLIGDPDDPNNRQVVVTEDTGPGVVGRWCDVFVETMYGVETWNTRYDSVWRVSYVTHKISSSDCRKMREYLNYNLHKLQTDYIYN